MRSAVSAILSAPAPESSMSHPDYRQVGKLYYSYINYWLLSIFNHCYRQHMIMLLCWFWWDSWALGLTHELSLACLTEFQGRILLGLKIVRAMWESSQPGMSGHILWKTMSGEIFRYKPLFYHEWVRLLDLFWDIFQTHRRVLGLLCVGECSSTQEVSELCRIHESLRAKFNSTLYDSRCVLLGLERDGELQSWANVWLKQAIWIFLPSWEICRLYFSLKHMLGTPYNASCAGDNPTSYPAEKSCSSLTDSTKETVQSATSFRYHDAPVEMGSLLSVADQTTPSNSVLTGGTAVGETASSVDGNRSMISHPTRTLYYPVLEKCVSLESDIQVSCVVFSGKSTVLTNCYVWILGFRVFIVLGVRV